MRLFGWAQAARTIHGRRLRLQPVKLDPVGYLSADSGPTQTPDSICHVCGVQICVLPPLWFRISHLIPHVSHYFI